jgi:hypothetical protein
MAKWEEMTRAERRVAVAKDVIKAINAGRFITASCTGYVVEREQHVPFTENTQSWARKALKSKCAVCARGAMMLCKVANYNNYTVDSEYAAELDVWGVGQTDTTAALKDCFRIEQLAHIESAFENGWSEIDDDESRLMAIMQCIIDHKGTFKADAEYEVA